MIILVLTDSLAIYESKYATRHLIKNRIHIIYHIEFNNQKSSLTFLIITKTAQMHLTFNNRVNKSGQDTSEPDAMAFILIHIRSLLHNPSATAHLSNCHTDVIYLSHGGCNRSAFNSRQISRKATTQVFIIVFILLSRAML